MVTQLGAVIVCSLGVAAGAWLAVSGLAQPAPSLRRAVRHLDRPRTTVVDRPMGTGTRLVLRATAGVLSSARPGSRWLPSEVQLRLVGRTAEQHLSYVASAAIAGLVLPTAVVALGQATGVLDLNWFAPIAAGLLAATVGVLLVHTATRERAEAVRADLRHQLSAYLDVVSMLLAGSSGYEGALEHAAHAGDGRLFAELRRSIRESSARAASSTDALGRVARMLGLDELEQVAAAAALSAAEGAPVARTLAAKCATLRNALASEQEAEARLRTSRLTTPVVGMALIFMALVIFPALSFS